MGMIIASDGNITHALKDGKRVLKTKNATENHYHDDREHEGFKKYYIENGNLICESILNMEYMGMPLLQDNDLDCGGKKYAKKK